jgi:putative transposase
LSLNLDLPPGFRAFDPQRPLTVYYRNLPHWRQDGATYFATFGLADALPKAKKHELTSMRREWEARHPPPRDESSWQEYAKTCFHKVEKWMDAGHGACWFRQPTYAKSLHNSILSLHEERYEIGCFVIMPNHCHLIMRPFESFRLEKQLGAIKSVIAHEINRYESKTGILWQQESYDRIIRDDEHLWNTIQYIGRNPGAAGIEPVKWYRWINPAWKAIGWDYQDEVE